MVKELRLDVTELSIDEELGLLKVIFYYINDKTKHDKVVRLSVK